MTVFIFVYVLFITTPRWDEYREEEAIKVCWAWMYGTWCVVGVLGVASMMCVHVYMYGLTACRYVCVYMCICMGLPHVGMSVCTCVYVWAYRM